MVLIVFVGRCKDVLIDEYCLRKGLVTHRILWCAGHERLPKNFCSYPAMSLSDVAGYRYLRMATIV